LAVFNGRRAAGGEIHRKSHKDRPLAWVLRIAGLVLSATALIGAGGSAGATTPSATARGPVPDSIISLVTDPGAVFSIPAVTRPAYLLHTTDPTFHTTVTRIADNTGDA